MCALKVVQSCISECNFHLLFSFSNIKTTFELWEDEITKKNIVIYLDFLYLVLHMTERLKFR